MSATADRTKTSSSTTSAVRLCGDPCSMLTPYTPPRTTGALGTLAVRTLTCQAADLKAAPKTPLPKGCPSRGGAGVVAQPDAPEPARERPDDERSHDHGAEADRVQ